MVQGAAGASTDRAHQTRMTWRRIDQTAVYRVHTNARPARDINDYTTHGCKKTLKKPLKTLFTVLLFCACCFICRLYLHMDLFSFYAKPYVFTFYVTVCESHIALKAT